LSRKTRKGVSDSRELKIKVWRGHCMHINTLLNDFAKLQSSPFISMGYPDEIGKLK